MISKSSGSNARGRLKEPIADLPFLAARFEHSRAARQDRRCASQKGVLHLRVRKRTELEQSTAPSVLIIGFVSRKRLSLPGDPHQCRLNAAHCLALSQRAWRPEVSQAFSDLAEMWGRLSAETEADQALYRALCEIELGEPCEALPRALNLSSWAA